MVNKETKIMSAELEDNTNALSLKESPDQEKRSTICVWCDGCFDLVHFGHAQFLRQARELCGKVIVGVHSDAEISKHKGRTVFNAAERFKMVKAIKWVDEVVMDSPYITSVAMMDDHNCEFCFHGNSIKKTFMGRDPYEAVKKARRYRELQCSAGVSIEDIFKRISVHVHNPGNKSFEACTLPMKEFYEDKPPNPGDKVVFVDGSFDLFHVGHVDFLEKAKACGDYLIVGLHADEIVTWSKGDHYPMMKMQERLRNLLACRYVDKVIVGTPYDVSEEFMINNNINVVCHGASAKKLTKMHLDPYAAAKAKNIYQEVDTGNSPTTVDVMRRILRHFIHYQKINVDK